MEKILYTREKELMKTYSVSRPVIRKWRDQGAPFLKVNRAVLYPLENFSEWVINNSTAARTVNFLIQARKTKELIENQNSDLK